MPSLVTTGAAVLHAPLFVVIFLIVSAGIGWRILRWLSVPAGGPVSERIVLALMLGAGALQFVPFALGVLGQLSVGSLRIALAVIALLAIWDAWAALRAVRSAVSARSEMPVWLLLWLLALAPMLLVAFLLALTPTLDPDGLGYHLTVPKRWLEQGSLAYLPTYPYSNTPMGVEMLFMNGLAVVGDTAAKLVHFSLGIVGAVGLYVAGKRVGGRPVSVVASTAFLCGPFGVGPLLGWAYLEGATSAAIITSALAWLVWVQERDRAWLRCAALLAGVSVSFKLTAGLFPVALVILTTVTLAHEARAQRRPILPVLASVAALAPLVVLPVVPWLVRSAILTGNPVFPMGAQWIPSRDFSPQLAKAFEHYNRYMVWGINLGPSWTLERRQLFFVGIACAMALLGGFVAWRQNTFMKRSTAFVVLGTLLVQLAAAGLYKRYWIPVLSIFQLPMIALFARQLSASWVRGALVAVTTVASLFQARQSLKTVENDAGGLIETALGAEAQSAFLMQHLTLFPLYQLANRDLAPNAGVVMSQYCGGFYLDRSTYCADITQESLRYTDLATCVSDLRHLGITHAIAPRFWALPGSKPTMEGGNVSMLVREGEHACISELIRNHARLLFAAGDQGLYALSLDSLP